ncbi:hypothetical protein UC8_12550 [Roseimaritima ulvae]|uniref:Uncharacterized protein n=1 Tax=Roseimaritima ulvae TaxID=980254 RepID=A0A5B9QZ61_9BACT|nr:hypothetical protein UC8_12550 [Roseimaritima ulvae]
MTNSHTEGVSREAAAGCSHGREPNAIYFGTLQVVGYAISDGPKAQFYTSPGQT